MVLHFTPQQLQKAIEALKSPWDGRLDRLAPPEGDALFWSYRCSGGHCHLICHGMVDLRVSEDVARSLQAQMVAADRSIEYGEAFSPARDYVM